MEIPFFSLDFFLSPVTKSPSVGSGKPSLEGRNDSISTNSFLHTLSASFAGTGGRFLLTTKASPPELGKSARDSRGASGVEGDKVVIADVPVETDNDRVLPPPARDISRTTLL